MARDALTGSRIRERRVMAGQKQADLARQIGISASYLNLIEHNRRRIGGKLLLDISAALQVEPQLLTDGAEAALIATLREAAEDAGLTSSEAERGDEFAGRFPGWADVLAGTYRRVATLERTVEALTDRLAHDPHLAASMHELLTTAAAIRSTAAILAETETLQPEWRDRFHANINEDSRRLSDSAQSLVSYLESNENAEAAVTSPQDEVETFLSNHAFNFAALEQGDADEDSLQHIIEDAPELGSLAAQFIAAGVLRQVAHDARQVSLDGLRAAVETLGVDPLSLAQNLGSSVACILRRLAALPELQAGLVVCDRSGTVIFRKSVEGFMIPRYGSCCPLWPLFAALSQPGLVLSRRVTQLGQAQAQFDSFATSEPVATAEYNAPPQVQSVMLLLPTEAGVATGQQVGATCRICPQSQCASRREPSIISAGV